MPTEHIITHQPHILNATQQDLMSAKQIMKKMRQHLRNVYLGAAHQSPDYQWWHGQPALDGDLLRIKSLIGELLRNKNLETH